MSNTMEVISNMEEINLNIMKQENEVLVINKEIDELKKVSINIELKTSFEISNAKTSDNKLLFTNDLSRKSAINESLKSNKEFNDLNKVIEAREIESQKRIIEINYSKRLFRIKELLLLALRGEKND